MTNNSNKPVIFLAFANDRDDTVGYLRNLPDEARRLRDVLETAERAGLCEVVVRSNSTAGDIFKVFQDPRYRNRVAIFHYGGHANGYQLLLESAAGQVAMADAGGFAAFLAQQQGLQLVFLNGCSTQLQTQALLDANITAVISTSRAIDDKVATDFAFQFYQGLAGGATIRTAFREAEASVQMASGGTTRSLYFGAKDNTASPGETDRWPWSLTIREGSEHADQWNLPWAVDDPLFGLPKLPEQDLPESPYRHLHWFTRKDAEIFFGRGHQIHELYDRLTAPSTAPIMLFYGQSGVGKSSILDAGLIPRLEQDYEVRYLRRGDSGLLNTLKQAFLPEAADLPIEDAWRVKEEQLGKPLIVFLDQVEEIFTRPLADMPDELEQLLKAVQAIFSDPNRRPQGKLVLGFRKEWLAELEAQLVVYELPRTKVFLEALDRRGIIEVVRGPVRSARLRERYGLTIDDGLAEIIADDLLEDRGSAIAPTLQILLTKMWARATEANYERPQFNQNLYQQMKRDGILLRDFLNQQIAAFGQQYPEVVNSGLLLDIIALHTTPLGTADQCSVEDLQRQYAHLGSILPAILQRCQDLYLLTVATSAQKDSVRTTRLAHDTLAPIVREQFDHSDKPGQRARRILDNRSVDWAGEQRGTPLDEADLKMVENGEAGTHVWNVTEQKLVNASRELRGRLQRTRKILKVVGAVAVAAIVGLGGFGWWNFNQAQTAIRRVEETNIELTKEKKETELALKKATQAKETSEQILSVIEGKAEKDVVIHGVLMEAYAITIRYLEQERLKDSKDTQIDRELAELSIGYAWHLNDHGESDLAIAAYSRSLELLTDLSKADPSDPKVALRCAFVMNNISWCYQTKGDNESALKQAEKTLQVRKQLLEKFPNEFEAKRQVSVSLGNLGTLYSELGRTDEGIECSLKGMAIEEELWREHPNNRWVGLNLSNSLANLSQDYFANKNVERAIELKTRAYELRKVLYDDAKAGKPSEDGLGFFNFEDKYGKIAFELAGLLVTVDAKNQRIDDYLKTALDILGKIHQRNTENDEYRSLYASALEVEARCFLSRGESENALKSVESSHAVAVGKAGAEAEKLANPEHAMLRDQQLSSTALLAYCLALAHESDRSRDSILEAAELYCRNSLVAVDENQELPADLNNAVEVLGNQIMDDPRVIVLLKEKETKVLPKTFQQLRSVFVK